MILLTFAPKKLQCFEAKTVGGKHYENLYKKYLVAINADVWSLIGNELKYDGQRDICTHNKSSKNNGSSLEVKTAYIPADYFVSSTQARVIWEKEPCLSYVFMVVIRHNDQGSSVWKCSVIGVHSCPLTHMLSAAASAQIQKHWGAVTCTAEPAMNSNHYLLGHPKYSPVPFSIHPNTILV